MSVTYPIIQYVSAPEPTATVRNDFNAEAARLVAEGFSLGSPQRLGEPDAINSSHGFRELTLPQRVMGTKAESLAILGNLEREANRRRNWLRIQLSPFTPPVYAHTYASDTDALDWSRVLSASDGSIDEWYQRIPIDADPWLYGDTETFSLSVTHTVGVGSNRQQIALPALKGDVAVPLNLSFASTTGPWLAALSPQDDATLNRWSVTAEASGSSALAAAPAAIAPGTYRIYAFQPTSSAVPLRFGWAPDNTIGNTLWNDDGVALTYHAWNDVAHTVDMSMQDLGSVQFIGAPGSAATIIPKIHMQRLTGSGTVNVVLMLVTVSDDRIDADGASVALTAGSSSATGVLWLGEDAVQSTVYTAAGQTFQSPVIGNGASVLTAYPQHQNILTLLGATVGADTVVTVTYRPLYRNLPW